MSTGTVRQWVIGCIGATINSAATGGIALIVDQHDFNPTSGGWRRLGAVMLVAAVTGGLLYVKQHELPSE